MYFSFTLPVCYAVKLKRYTAFLSVTVPCIFPCRNEPLPVNTGPLTLHREATVKGSFLHGKYTVYRAAQRQCTKRELTQMLKTPLSRTWIFFPTVFEYSVDVVGPAWAWPWRPGPRRRARGPTGSCWAGRRCRRGRTNSREIYPKK